MASHQTLIVSLGWKMRALVFLSAVIIYRTDVIQISGHSFHNH